MKRSRVAVSVAGLVLVGAGCSATSGTDSAEPTAVSVAATIDADNSDVAVADTTIVDPAIVDPAIGDATIADRSVSDPSDSAVSAVPTAAAVPSALQFTAPAVGGGEIDAASFAGKPTVFWFWAPT